MTVKVQSVSLVVRMCLFYGRGLSVCVCMRLSGLFLCVCVCLSEECRQRFVERGATSCVVCGMPEVVQVCSVVGACAVCVFVDDKCACMFGNEISYASTWY
jgi:hypothetical protein